MKTLAILLLVCFASALAAQEPAATSDPADKDFFPDAEFVSSTSFRSAAYIQRLWRGLHVEGDYFGGDENDVGYTGATWEFRWQRWRLTPGFGVSYGGNSFRTMPSISFRWDYEKNWFVTEGLVLQGLLDTARNPDDTPEARAEGSVRPTITDGDHISVRWRRLTIGGTWERIQFREIEWKGGGRVALRLAPHLSVVVFVLGPGSEVRGGLILHPAEN
jgi:hypothetical protein